MIAYSEHFGPEQGTYDGEKILNQSCVPVTTQKNSSIADFFSGYHQRYMIFANSSSCEKVAPAFERRAV